MKCICVLNHQYIGKERLFISDYFSDIFEKVFITNRETKN